MSEHLSGYQARDHEVVDYGMYELPGTNLQFRGPALTSRAASSYFTCIGAAQTFGCLVERPYPQLLSSNLDLPALNLGYGGAGPEFFERQRALDDHVNRGAFVIVQVMSGRSQSNSLFDTRGLEYLYRRADNVRMGAFEAYSQAFAGPSSVRRLPPRRLTQRLARLAAAPRLRRVVEETRQGWVESYRQLLARYRVPKILLWFSTRSPHYHESFLSIHGAFGEYPQLVQKWMVDEVARLCDDYVECVSSRGSPQPLISRFTGRPTTIDPRHDRPDLAKGEPWRENRYYPSPEMYEDAAVALLAPCRRHVDPRRPIAV